MIPPEVMDGVMRRLATIPFFPSDDADRLVVMEAICAFANSPAALERASRAAVLHIERWQGIPPLRALYSAEVENVYLERQTAENSRQLAEWKREQRALPAAASAPQLEAAVKEIPKPVRIPSTPVRTQEERAKLEADTLERVRQYQLSQPKGQTSQ